LIALSVIAALAIGGQVLVQLSLIGQRGDSHIVNQAGYQRMLSQRIALKLMLYDAANPDAVAQIALIAAMRDRWVGAHGELAGRVERIAYGQTARATLTALMHEVDQPLQRISGLITTLQNTGSFTATERAALMADQELFLPLMDAIVLGFEQSVQARVAFLQRVELTLLIITLIVLALEALLIFRPAVNRLQSSVDQLERRNRQATRRLESLRHLAGGIAHHFNNLLTGIMGNAELGRIDAIQHQRTTEYLDAQIGDCKRAAEIVTHLLAYSGHGRNELEPVELGAWLAGVVGSFAPANPAIKLDLEVTGNAVAAVDRLTLKQALEGILLNAVESMKDQPSGQVRIKLSQVMFAEPKLASGPYRTELPVGLYACIQVSDDGKGIAPEELDRIFDPYYTSKEFGRGLGLASVLGVVHGHDGGIEVHSRPGQGSIVSLYIPLTASEAVSPLRSGARSSQTTLR
jgi:signal transduction histidine kinase